MKRRVDLAVCALALTVFVALVCSGDNDPDLWGRMAYARDAAAAGQLVLKSDIYSYTAPGARWIDHEWGFNWIVFATHALLGWPGLRAIRVAFYLGSLAIVLRPAVRAALGTPMLAPLLFA